MQRRMLCTNDRFLLNSAPGKTVLNYKPPSGSLGYNPKQKNLISTWDIFMQQYRMVSCETVDVVSVIRSTPPEEFWKYFQQNVLRLQSQTKANMMNT